MLTLRMPPLAEFFCEALLAAVEDLGYSFDDVLRTAADRVIGAL
jgi:hypothetical protein